MRRIIYIFILSFCFANNLQAQQYENQPQIMNVEPGLYESQVDSNLSIIRIEFNQDMNTGMSIMNSTNMVPFDGNVRWASSRVVEIPVKVESGKLYDLHLNDSYHRNFQNASGTPFDPVVLAFHTQTDTAQCQLDSSWIQNRYRDFKEHFMSHYSYKDLHGISWEEEFDSAGAAITSACSESEFGLGMLGLLSKAEDLHLRLEIDGVIYNCESRALVPVAHHFEAVHRDLEEVVASEHGIVHVGSLDSTGYIAISSLLSKYEDDMTFAIEHLKTFQDKSYLIIDLRANTGGWDKYAKTFVSHLIEDTIRYEKIVVYNEATGEFDDSSYREVIPADNSIQFKGKVFVLIDGNVMSSAEAFVLMLKQLPDVVLVGNTTGGSTGNPQKYGITGSVAAHIPSWQAYDMEGNLIEGNGIVPDVSLNYPEEDFTYRDPVFSYVLSSIDSLNNPTGMQIPTFNLDIFPNPASDEIILHAKAFTEEACIVKLIDLQGRVMFSRKFYHRENQKIKLDLRDEALLPGIYLIQVQFKHYNLCRKVMIH